MAKHTDYSDGRHNDDDHLLNSFDDFDLDAEIDKLYSQPKRRSQRKKNARRLIEQYEEEKDLKARLDEYYYHIDD